MKNFIPYYRRPRREPLPIPRSFNNPALISGHHDCGSGWVYGICPQCKRGHGFIIRLTPSLP